MNLALILNAKWSISSSLLIYRVANNLVTISFSFRGLRPPINLLFIIPYQP